MVKRDSIAKHGFTWITVLTLCAAWGCSSCRGNEGNSSVDSDTDIDTDSDTDSDADSDTDSDTDTDTGTDDCVHPEVKADCNDGWCKIPNGCYILGSPDYEGNNCRAAYAETEVQVTLTRDFEIKQTEVTQANWQAVGFDLPPHLAEAPCPDCPVSWVTIYEAMEYCNALSRAINAQECYDLSKCTGGFAAGCPDSFDWGCTPDDAYVCPGKIVLHDNPYSCPGYRLPTTAEWEYAARAGTTTANYMGDLEPDINSLCEPHKMVDPIAWHCGNTDIEQGPIYIPVAQKTPNGFGLYDVHGNVREYCSSSAQNLPLEYLVGEEGPLVDPSPPLEEFEEHMEVVTRGCKNQDAPCYCRSAWTPGSYADLRLYGVGFRPVRTLGFSGDEKQTSKTQIE